MNPSPDRLTYLKLAAVTMIWGGTFVAGRYLAAGLDPLLAATVRFALASLALLAFLGVARIRLVRPTTAQWVQMMVLGFFGIFFYNLCFFYGLHYINASRASLIVALNPAVIGLASWLLFKERLGCFKLGANRVTPG
ncbi:MAG: DMT family transporter, partial [Pseudomonas sp.]